MGRPLNKKYFGNRNVGSASTTDDDKIGGEGIGSISWSNYGSWLSSAGGALAPLAGLALPAPSIPGGVQATWTNYFGASAVTTGAGKTGLVTGDTYNYAPIPGLLVTIGSTAGANALFTVTTPGSTTALLTDLTGVNITKVSGTGAASSFLVDIKLKIVDTVIVEEGSGYTGTETFTVTLANSASGTVPVGTIVLTTDQNDANGNQYASQSGAQNRDAYEDNAILIYAKTTSGGTSRLGDIVSQKGRSVFKINTTDGTANCLLKASAVSAAGECTITATDSDTNTYFVTKISSHRCTVTQGTGTQFTTGQSVPWTFGSAVEGVSVKIPNA